MPDNILEKKEVIESILAITKKYKKEDLEKMSKDKLNKILSEVNDMPVKKEEEKKEDIPTVAKKGKKLLYPPDLNVENPVLYKVTNLMEAPKAANELREFKFDGKAVYLKKNESMICSYSPAMLFLTKDKVKVEQIKK